MFTSNRYVSRSLLCIVMCFMGSMAFGQAPTTAMRANNILYRYSQLQTGQGGGVIMNLPSSDVPEIIGNTYWDNRWSKSSLLLYKNEELVEGYLIRYDIYKSEFEFRINNDVKVLKGSFVKNMVWLDSITERPRYMVNGKDFREEGVSVSGFLEVLVEGKNGLFKKVNLEILKPDFNPALNVGSSDYRILKKEAYYYNESEKLIRIKIKKKIWNLCKRKGITRYRPL
ncbi:MAG: hypothetical protein HC811_13755 [Flammeovirgaceae bacterium]|nr:hypothetical protein [Flammeovirgaceae bacterium]